MCCGSEPRTELPWQDNSACCYFELVVHRDQGDEQGLLMRLVHKGGLCAFFAEAVVLV